MQWSVVLCSHYKGVEFSMKQQSALNFFLKKKEIVLEKVDLGIFCMNIVRKKHSV